MVEPLEKNLEGGTVAAVSLSIPTIEFPAKHGLSGSTRNHSWRRLRPKILLGKDLPNWFYKHPRKAYIISHILATPSWVKMEDLDTLYRQAQELSKTGVEYVVDHIIPLNHPYVCGLHVPWNLQVITRKANAAKSNRWMPDQLDLPI